MSPGPPIDSPKQALRAARIVWAVFLLGQVGVGAFALILLSGDRPEPSGDAGGGAAKVTSLVALVALLACTLAGYLARQQAFKRGWRGNAVEPRAYLTGTLLLLAPLEGAGLLAIVLALFEGRVFPPMMLAALAVAVQAMNFPTGSAMDETIPDLTRR